jgi:ubiquinone/menaquinone biosynthesis C-methylase UbiE
MIAPRLLYSQAIYEEVLREHVRDGITWLDVGCGQKILPTWRNAQEKEIVARCRQIVGIDFDMVSLCKPSNIKDKTRGEIKALPFRNESFDLVTANMVVEHLREPRIQFEEIKRVLKPRGLFIFHTPNVFGYPTILGRLIPESLKAKLIHFSEGREDEDVFPTYYRVNSRKKIYETADKAGFKVRKIKMLTSTGLPMLAAFPPLSILELLCKRLLLTSALASLRDNIIAVLENG